MKKKGVLNIPDQTAIGGYRQQTVGARDAKSYTWAGRIVNVDVETMVCSIRLDSGYGEYHDVPIPAPGGAGPRSWSGNIPERGSKVLLGWKKFGNRGFLPYIIEFLTPGTFMSRDYEPFSTVDPVEAKQALDLFPELEDDPGVNLSVVRLKNRKAYSGDFVASSSSGSDVLLDRNVHLVNRAGNEFVLRDSDQTAVLQTLNEFTSNAAGFYRRGLIKRNAFSFLPDLFPENSDGTIPDTISTDSPAFQTLYEFGLVDATGKKTFPNDNNYPNVVTPDGQHVAYVVEGDQSSDFSETMYAYTEDRRELKHISDGIMSVTEEGDGFQVDPPYPVFIEDVHGTVVGNDFHSSSGKSSYKRILKMRLFSSPDQSQPSNGPILEPVDMVNEFSYVDDIALARFYRILSPNGSNQYAFGVTKEGKVSVHIPKTKSGTSDMKGQSLDANIQGMIKAIIGMNENQSNTSIDLRTLGGVNLDIGRFSDGSSIKLNLKGKIRKTHIGNDADGLTMEEVYGGSTFRSVSATDTSVVGGSSIEDIVGEKNTSANSIVHNSGTGGYKQYTAGDKSTTVLGSTQEKFGMKRTSTFLRGHKSTTLAGSNSTEILVGSSTENVLAGSSSRSVVTGSMSNTVTAGSMSNTVVAGSYSTSVAAGPLSLAAAAGPVSVFSSVGNSITSSGANILKAPVTQIGMAVTGFAVAGIPGPGGPHIDYITGIPILGIPTIQIG